MRYDEIFAVDGKVQKPKAQKPKVQKPKVQKRTGVLVTGSTSPRILGGEQRRDCFHRLQTSLFTTRKMSDKS